LLTYVQFATLPSSSASESSSPNARDLQGIISSLLHTYNTTPPSDSLAQAQTELNHVKDIMVRNVEQILSRGERIELLVDKTDVMAGQATVFRRGARSVRRGMWWREKKVMALGAILTLVRMLVPLRQLAEDAANYLDTCLFLGGRSLRPWFESLWIYFVQSDDIDLCMVTMQCLGGYVH